MTDTSAPAGKRPHQSKTLQVCAVIIAIGAVLPDLMPAVDILAGSTLLSPNQITAIRVVLVLCGIVFGKLRLVTGTRIDLTPKGNDQ